MNFSATSGSPLPVVWRLVLSAGLIIFLLELCSRLSELHRATVALMMILVIIGLAAKWGELESLTAALVGGIGFDYFFLPPQGLRIHAMEDLLDFTAFVVTAVVAGQLVARSKRLRIEAEQRREELEKLYRLSGAMLNSGGPGFSLEEVARELAEIFSLEGVALYNRHTGQIVRAGADAGAISDQALERAAMSTLWLAEMRPPVLLARIRHSDELLGSIGIHGAQISEALMREITARVGLGLESLHAMEKFTEAELLRRSEELKSAVLDAMAHEIRSPLNSIKLAATTLLSDHARTGLQNQEMLTIIEEEANRMDRTIDEALMLARLEADELSLRKEPQDLSRLIPAAVEAMGAAVAGRSVEVSVPESLPLAECDKGMMVRVLKQLLNNALKYSPDGSPLTLSADFTGEAIVIDVVDRGPGVAETERDRIFEKYYRGRGTPIAYAGNGPRPRKRKMHCRSSRRGGLGHCARRRRCRFPRFLTGGQHRPHRRVRVMAAT